MITCKDLKVGTWYKFHPDVLANNNFTNATWEKREFDSVIVVVGDNFVARWATMPDYVGEVTTWEGHQNYAVEIVAKTETDTPQVLPASSVPPVTVKREVLTIDKIGVGQTFIVHGNPEEVYVKISNSHVFNHKHLQMHTTVAERFKSHLNLVVVELVVYNGK